MDTSLHFIQKNIIKKLLFNPEVKFSDLKIENLGNNFLVYHLEQLIKNNIIEKVDNIYKLTLKGKEFAGRFDIEEDKISKQPKIGVFIMAYRIDPITQEYSFVMQTRLKQPFFGCQGFPTGKVRLGESFVEVAERELLEETGLIARENSSGIFLTKRYFVISAKDKTLLEDKIFYYVCINSPEGELADTNEGKNAWVKESELKSFIQKPFEDIEQYLSYIAELKKYVSGELNGYIKYIENIEETSEF